MVSIEKKIDLVRAFMQIEGNVEIKGICYNYNLEGGVSFLTYVEVNKKMQHIDIVMDKNQVELLGECNTVSEIYECYKEMGYFTE